MTHRFSTFALILLAALPAAADAQELTASEEAVIRAEARHHIETYYGHYYERNMEPLPESIFHIPWILSGSGGVQVTETAEEALESFESSLAGLLERDWDRSIYRTANVCVLNAGTAIVSGTNTRTRADGSIMSVGGVSYILGMTDDGWRIISYSGHSPDKVVRCD